MYTTRYSLMQRVKDEGDSVAWQEFYDLYRPLIYRYCNQRGLNHSDAEEIVGECFEQLCESMPEFDYQPSRGKFKSWLKKLVNNRISNRLKRKREGALPNPELDVAADDAPSHDQLWEKNWKHELLSYCVQQARSEVSSRNFQIFHLHVIEEWAPEKIAELFSLTTEQVYRAKYKVLQVVRDKMARYLEAAD